MGSLYVQVMHRAHCISLDASVEAAANLVVQKRAHRICVVDDSETLVGVVSRGDIMRATMSNFQYFMEQQDRREVP
jgi:CBS domain-containing protein